MCLYARRDAKILTAEKNIDVYKVINILTNKSFMQDFQYKPNTLYRLKKKIEPKVLQKSQIVHSGFHSFTKEPHYMTTSIVDVKIVKFTIPKGAKYMISADGKEMVSTSIRSGSLEAL